MSSLSSSLNDFRANLSSLRKLLEIRSNIKKSNACLVDAEAVFSTKQNDFDSSSLMNGATSLGILSSCSFSSTQRSLSQMLNSEITQNLSSLSKILDEKLRSGLAVNVVGKNCSAAYTNNNTSSNTASSLVLSTWSHKQTKSIELRDSYRMISKLARILSETLSVLRKWVFDLTPVVDDDEEEDDEKKSASTLISRHTKNNLTIFDENDKNFERNALFSQEMGIDLDEVEIIGEESSVNNKNKTKGRSVADYKIISLIERGVSPILALEEYLMKNKDFTSDGSSNSSLSGIYVVDWLETFVDECFKQDDLMLMSLK